MPELDEAVAAVVLAADHALNAHDRERAAAMAAVRDAARRLEQAAEAALADCDGPASSDR